MKAVSLRSYVYFALCELSDAQDNLYDISSRLTDDQAKVLIADVMNDVDSALSKLQNFSL